MEFLLNNREKVEDVKSLSDIDELNNAFWKLNKVEIGPQSTTIIGARGSRENSTAEWTQNDDLGSQLPPTLGILLECLLISLRHGPQLVPIRCHIHVVLILFHKSLT